MDHHQIMGLIRWTLAAIAMISLQEVGKRVAKKIPRITRTLKDILTAVVKTHWRLPLIVGLFIFHVAVLSYCASVAVSAKLPLLVALGMAFLTLFTAFVAWSGLREQWQKYKLDRSNVGL